MKLRSLLVALTLVVLAAPAFAGKKTPLANKRADNQQKRIDQGVRSGELTPEEAKRLEAQQAKIDAEKKAAKADGKVTPKERAQLQQDQNKANRTIVRKKHNSRGN